MVMGTLEIPTIDRETSGHLGFHTHILRCSVKGGMPNAIFTGQRFLPDVEGHFQPEVHLLCIWNGFKGFGWSMAVSLLRTWYDNRLLLAQNSHKKACDTGACVKRVILMINLLPCFLLC